MGYLSDSDKEYYLEPPITKADWSFKWKQVSDMRDNFLRVYLNDKNHCGGPVMSGVYYERYKELDSFCDEWYALYEDYYNALPEK